MNQLPTFIEYLLLSHDYVVMPGLGTFIVQKVNARRNEDEEIFLPPYRSVRFNTELTSDDNLLVDSIEKIHACTREQAAQRLGAWTTEFMQGLEDNGFADFGALGTFTLEDDHTLLFTPQESGVTTPEYYGLDAFHFGELQPAQQKQARIIPLAASMEADDKAITIRINRRIANFVAVACTAILLFTVFNLPVRNNNLELKSSLRELLMPTGLSPRQNVIEPETPVVVKKAPVKVAPVVAPVKIETPSENGKYCIVMACSISPDNAEKYVSTLSQRGLENARVMTSGEMLRVVVGSYETEGEAYSALREMRKSSDKYPKAWVYRIP